MAVTSTKSVEPSPARSGRRLVWLGVGVFVLGFILYLLQIQASHLRVPWYLPVLGTLGAGLVLAAFIRRRTLVRRCLVLVLGLLAAGEWFVLLSLSRLPEYAGPAAVERSFPEFATQKADGTPFTQADLRGPRHTALVFFRGRW